jgi:phospholipid/cholesterol/gamma-HCH transport system substrate-binding protein
MNSRRGQVLVGLFVLAAVAILVGTVLAVSGTFSKKGIPHRTYFKFASGLAPAAPVRYGGLLAGRVEALRVDPQDSTRIEVDFTVGNEIPLKTDSLAKITALSALGESYLEVTTGSKDAPLAPPDSIVKSKETIGIGDLGDIVGGLAPTADQVLQNLNQRLMEIKVTVAEVNDLLGDQNREKIRNSLGTLDSMLTETRPKVSATLDNVQAATGKLQPVIASVQTAADKVAPLLDDVKGTIKQANDALAHVDSLVLENRPDIQASIVELRKTLNSASAAVDELHDTLDRNTGNIDDSLANVRAATGNLKELTDSVKRKPSLLIRGETGKDRKPGDKY